jgi:hypothetical protein
MIQSPLRVLLTGGLGNQLFQTAAAFHIRALTKRETVMVRDANSYSKYNHGSRVENLIANLSVEGKEKNANLMLRLDRRLVRDNHIYADLRRIQVHQELGFDPDFTLKKHTNELRGYFQSYIYAEAFREIYQDSISSYLRSSPLDIDLNSSSIACPVSLHMRRGDYETLRTTFGLLDFEYYENALEELDAHEEIKEIWVFSDDVSKASTILSRSRFLKFMNFQIASSLDEIDSLVAMTLCSRHIVANSTFSWWGAFLTDGPSKVIVPDKWFRSGDEPYKLIPNNWTRVESKWEL